MKNKLFILSLFISTFSFGQDTLRGSYKQLTLRQNNTYYIRGIVSVDGLLKAEPGITILFDEGASLVCFNGVQLNGTQEKQIVLKSLEGRKGRGLVIRGEAEEQGILIASTRFENLVMPLSFDERWLRSDVDIRNSYLIKNQSSSSVISVSTPSIKSSVTNTPVNFVLSNNVFAENVSAVEFQDLNSESIKISVKNNLFIANVTADYGVYNYSGNVIFGRADLNSNSYKAEFKGNSFLQNYLINLSADTVLQETSIGVYGNAENLMAEDNFWGYTNETAIRKNLYDYYTNYTAPRILIQPFLAAPSSSIPPHIYKVVVNDLQGNAKRNDNILLDRNFNLQQSGVKSFLLIANKTIQINNARIILHSLNDTLKNQDFLLTEGVSLRSIGSELLLNLDSSALEQISKQSGFLEITGLTGVNKEYVPPIKIGFPNFMVVKKQLVEERALKLANTKVSTEPPQPPKRDTLVQIDTIVQILKPKRLMQPPPTTFKRGHLIYMLGSINSSVQSINDSRPLGTFIYPIATVPQPAYTVGGSVGLRWNRNHSSHFAYGTEIAYSYLQPRQNFVKSYTLPPFNGRYTGFVSPSIFQFLGIEAFIKGRYSGWNFIGGGKTDLNFTRKSLFDQNQNSYKNHVYSAFIAIEYETSGDEKTPSFTIGAKARKTLSFTDLEKITNDITMLELYLGMEIKTLTKFLNKQRPSQKNTNKKTIKK